AQPAGITYGQAMIHVTYSTDPYPHVHFFDVVNQQGNHVHFSTDPSSDRSRNLTTYQQEQIDKVQAYLDQTLHTLLRDQGLISQLKYEATKQALQELNETQQETNTQLTAA